MTTTSTPTARTDTAAVQIRGLVKTFGHTRALDGLDLTVQPGSVTGFLGPNGAGKSTTIRVLLGLLRADSGAVRLLGRDPRHDAVALHRRIAYVPGDVTLWPNLAGAQAIDFLTGLRGGADVRRRDELIERFELDPHKKARTYSKGNRQQVALVAAFSTNADIYLDERHPGIGWAAVTFIVAALYLGALLRLPDWLIDASPVGRTTAPSSISVVTLSVMVVVAAGLTLVAGWLYRRRDAA